MTHTRSTPASQKTNLPVPSDAHLDERSRRAREEPMLVTAFGGDVYEVETEPGHRYLANVVAGRCTCPDHLFRDARCKHLRRVAIEITEGRVPPPGHVAVPCAVCSEEVFVRTASADPHLCPRHRFQRGDVARDRETGGLVLVVAVSNRRADEVRIPSQDCTVAEYATNRAYPASDPVVSAVYPAVRVTGDGPAPESLRVYSFPVSRLVRPES
ncbi:SWIM zinc finger family protein [Haloarchaeobius sp. HME9146]|uniref:SWIM zinc finger family protein n=1 Tax=Haloarchaeobius sp. HME9146 TaxID=2978732 RepID=UPI0021BF3D44|nr:SWIM zinc finger family protein [Haloarchaeobius sp. HME9146]MCT9095096.1 SWIM zinc finger family protein [Haloarchaeobius sp. HME9146]